MTDLRKSLEAYIQKHMNEMDFIPENELDFIMGAHFLLSDLLQCVEALGFYSCGGNFNYDLWVDKESGAHFTGKHARQTLSQLKEKWGL